LKEVLKPEFKTEMIHKTKPSESENRLELLLELCQEAKDATYRKKGNKAESGYVLNITETCSEKIPSSS